MMNYSLKLSHLKPIVLTLLLSITPAYCLNSTCGDLITYNQLPVILLSAPTCFRNGCGANSLTSMSSDCDPNSGCYPIWTILNEKWQKDHEWCTYCSSDRACRNPGWPVFNASAACDISPNAWVFGNGGCCIGKDEPASLAKWIETTCNETWRISFKYYDGQAKEDWQEYLLPWNWTVSANNDTDQIVEPYCPNKPLYLGLFAIENIVFLIFTIAYAMVTLWVIREKRITGPDRLMVVRFILAILKPVKYLKKGASKAFDFIFRLKEEENEGTGTGTIVTTLLTAILFSGVQLGVNFAAAYIIKFTPGYSHVPAPLLALLFCCRPRLGWVACLVPLFSKRWLRKYSGLQPEDPLFQDAGMAINRVGVGSAVGEVIMQLLGAYFLGKAAHVGVIKGFYHNDRLTPFFRGMQARNMYVGAMFWLAASFGVVIGWLVYIYLTTRDMKFFARTKKWIKQVTAAAIPEKVLPQRMQSWRRSTLPSRRSSRRRNQSDALDDNLISRRHAQQPEDEGHNFLGGAAQHPEDERYNIRGGGAGNGTMYGSDQTSADSFNIRRHEGSTSGTYGSNNGSTYEDLPVRPGDFPQTLSSGSPASGNSRPRSQQSGYQALPVNPEMVQMRPGDLPTMSSPRYSDREVHEEHNIRRHTPMGVVNEAEDPQPVYIRRRGPARDQYQDTAYHGAHHDDHDELIDADRNPSPVLRLQGHFPATVNEWEPYVLGLAFLLGGISYLAQWLFWEGFVYAAGDAFCPPKLGFTGTVWAVGAIISMYCSSSQVQPPENVVNPRR